MDTRPPPPGQPVVERRNQRLVAKSTPSYPRLVLSSRIAMR